MGRRTAQDISCVEPQAGRDTASVASEAYSIVKHAASFRRECFPARNEARFMALLDPAHRAGLTECSRSKSRWLNQTILPVLTSEIVATFELLYHPSSPDPAFERAFLHGGS